MIKIDINRLTDVMREYVNTKEEYKDAVLFYRMGDFYEFFFEDAVEMSRALDLTLTGKDCGLDERAPMCGIPFHAAETYINKLIKLGYKVAICEQTNEFIKNSKYAICIESRNSKRFSSVGSLQEKKKFSSPCQV